MQHLRFQPVGSFLSGLPETFQQLQRNGQKHFQASKDNSPLLVGDNDRYSHLFVQLLARYVTFVKSMLSNDAFEVCFLANLALNDKTTVVGQSVGRMMELCNHHVIETLSARLVIENMGLHV